MSYTVKLRLKKVEGALERALGLARRRGYEIGRVLARPSADGVFFEVTLRIENQRPAELLARQLGKLFEVEKVDVHEQEPQEGGEEYGWGV